MKLVLFRLSIIAVVLVGIFAVSGESDARGRRRLPRRGGCSTCAVEQEKCPAVCPCGCADTGECDCD